MTKSRNQGIEHSRHWFLLVPTSWDPVFVELDFSIFLQLMGWMGRR